MTRDAFKWGLCEHFGLCQDRDVNHYVDLTIWVAVREYTLNVIKFDAFLHAKFGQYEAERKMSAFDLITAEYGDEAAAWCTKEWGR